MKRFFVILLFISSVPSFALEPKKDSTDRRSYSNELGFFQKAERELNDPRFMFHDDKIDMDMGIGGTVGVKGAYTFAGSVYSASFQPAMINIPAYSNSFQVTPQSCELHAKARAKLFGHKIIAFVKFQGENTDKFYVKLDQAYISVDGFSAGLIPSFFNDLESGVRADAMSNQQSDVTHPLIGYTFRKNGWEGAISAELADIDMSKFIDLGIESNYQPMPDFVIHGKKRWDKGHVQLGAVFRNLTYWKSEKTEEEFLSKSGNGHAFGWGLSLSGNYLPSKSLKLSYALIGGAGISKYADILAPAQIDVGIKYIQDKEYTMSGVPLVSASLMAQYWWRENLSSSFVLQYARTFMDSFIIADEMDRSNLLGLANIYWYMSDFAYVGLQYMYGRRSVYEIPDYLEHVAQKSTVGNAHRVTAVLKFMF